MATISKKICLVGDFSVGKTSLIRRFVDRQFSDQYLSTVGVKISKKLIDATSLKLPEGDKFQLMVWDIEGRTDYKPIDVSYLRGASGIIIVSDSSRMETVENLDRHLQMFQQVNPKGSVVIAFNKADLIEPTMLTKVMGLHSFAHESQVVATYATSAKTGDNVDKMFLELSQSMLNG
ncbi:GTP-binding protein [Limnothrix sp. FACHB-881]|uniref:Rab family GTPase n=1 Tax=unclassified Limnothrix TaxID=2632864 RepID=UPI00081F1918|nr:MULTISPECIES: Rab family GTPase [unclassified Limnothrix]OCQ95457.1 GTP-binding protein [Limnothrix sp. P13C2]MBD2162658.1 GTP-binding protein [Limnothrix sp. FACHB-1083]MBD2193695.1 GTP-binding protein [Limnothrix sp. FACHB-1088]MBD2634590.1 GTP-binding protein [Limnothrix sp. FACHB-881]PIB15157.1 GTP-binding protein [Limnothrix sp. PR1529]